MIQKPTEPRVKHTKPEDFAKEPGRVPRKEDFIERAIVEEECVDTVKEALEHLTPLSGMREWLDQCPHPTALEFAKLRAFGRFVELELDAAFGSFDEAAYLQAVESHALERIAWEEAKKKSRAHNKKARTINATWNRWEEAHSAELEIERLKKRIKELESE